MRRQTLWVTLGCLLHDVGKISCRAGQGESHSAAGYSFLQKNGSAFPSDVLDCVRWHSAQSLEKNSLQDDSIAYIVYAADQIAKISDRFESERAQQDRQLALSPIFTHLNGEHAGYTLRPEPQDGVLRMPCSGAGHLKASAYGVLEQKLASAMRELTCEPEWVDSLLSTLEYCASTIPASTLSQENPDISLFDHLKTTAALGACISEYLLDEAQTNYRRALFEEQAEFRKAKAFLLYSADFSGVQKFIYTVLTEGALRTLRSRSFFLEFAMEHYVDELLLACGVSRANLLYSGGAHCYLLLPNTQRVERILNAWNTRFNEWLFAQFGTRLFLAHGYTACSADDLTNVPADRSPYKAMFHRVSSQVASHKMHRVTASQLRALNADAMKQEKYECAVCGRSDRLIRTKHRCVWCERFETLSRKIQTCDMYFVSTSPNAPCDFKLPAFEGKVYVFLSGESAVRARLAAGEHARRIYVKNRRCADLPFSTCMYVGDYAAANRVNELTRSDRGSQRLAVCRMDVDNLGQAFVAGFEREDASTPEQRNRYVTLLRTAAFSREMSLFFKLHINALLSGNYQNRRPLSTAIVYSGGDDVFLLGAWDDVLEGALRIRTALKEYTCGALTISAGIGIFDVHFPIRTAALQTARLEDEAKDFPGKDAIALFDGGENVYPWDVFLRDVLGEKIAVLKAFFNAENSEYGKSLLYRMLGLLRDARSDRMPLARYAYLLSRLKPVHNMESADLDQEFCRKMYEWALSAEGRRRLITAIHIFVYLNQGECDTYGGNE